MRCLIWFDLIWFYVALESKGTEQNKAKEKNVTYQRRKSERNALVCIKREDPWKEIEALPQKECHDWKENTETKI